MTAKEYLNQAFTLDNRINGKLEQVSALHALATKATQTLSDMPPSGTRNVQRMEDIICKIIWLEDSINDDIDQLVDLKREIMTMVKGIDSTVYQTLLEQRYLGCKTWKQIAADLGYELRWMHRLHTQALQEVEKLLFSKRSHERAL